MTEPEPAVEADPSPSKHQSVILRQVFRTWLWIAGGGSLLLLIGYVASGFAYQFLAILLSALLVVASVYWGGASLGTPQFRLSIPAMALAHYFGSAVLGLFFPLGAYAFFATAITNMLLVALANKDRQIGWMGGIGALGFILFVFLDSQGLTEGLRYRADTAASLLIPGLLAGMIPVAGAFTYLLTRSLRQSLREAEQRRQIAEEARGEQAATLARVEQQSAEQARLLDLVRDLETPIIPLLEGVLVLPLVGNLDTGRLSTLTQTLLDRVSSERAHTVVIDVTAVSLIDTATANHLIQLTRGVRLLGAECIMTGIRAEVAQTLVGLGVTWGSVKTAASLRDGLTDLLLENA